MGVHFTAGVVGTSPFIDQVKLNAAKQVRKCLSFRGKRSGNFARLLND